MIGLTRIPGLVSTICLFLLAGCGGSEREAGTPLQVSIIGSMPQLAVPAPPEPTAPQAALLLAAAQGLVSFDAAGQIEAGLAERWNVSDDGLSYIFRLRDAAWADGRAVVAADVVSSLRAAIAAGSRNRLAVLFGAVDAIVAVTPQVIEIRLKAPRPLLLPLLAQPDLGMIRRKQGTGPFRIASRGGGVIMLEPRLPEDGMDMAQATYPVRMRAERAAAALVRFRQGQSAAVLGGTLADLPIARAADLRTAQLRFDPAQGLFGLAVMTRTGFLATADNRNALAMAIDRDAIIALFGVREWRAAVTILPLQLDMAAPPTPPDWSALNLDVRRALARSRVMAWRANHDDAVPTLTIALPAGPGSTMLFSRLAADLGYIGVRAVRVGPNAAADLQLIDSVSPSDSATWYLRRLSCASGLPCGETGDKALMEARDTLSLQVRAAKLKEAETAYTTNMPFIPIAGPLRWSAVSAQITGFVPNARAVHPLGRLLKP